MIVARAGIGAGISDADFSEQRFGEFRAEH